MSDHPPGPDVAAHQRFMALLTDALESRETTLIAGGPLTVARADYNTLRVQEGTFWFSLDVRRAWGLDQEDH